MDRVRTAVIGVGSFGRNHLRVIQESPLASLAGIVEPDPARAAEAHGKYACPEYRHPAELAGKVDAAIVASPTETHASIGCELLESGIDVLIEKPIAVTPAEGRRLIEAAARHNRILAVGHLERFNPAILALQKLLTVPLFFEIHRMSEFSPRSLDVDVVLDLMIHDLDIVLALCGGALPAEIRAAGVSILSPKVDLASVRLAFPGGCIANLTASRVSTERIRKLRLFQPHQYVSIDYARQDGAVFSVKPGGGIGFAPLAVNKDEPLRLELEDFFEAVRERRRPRVDGEAALRALEVATRIREEIDEHGREVAGALARATGHPPVTS